MEKQTVRTIIIAGVVFVAALVGGIYLFNKKEAQIQALVSEKNQMAEQIQTRDSLMTDMEDTFTQIENSLTFIKEKRSSLSIENTEGKKDPKKALVADVQLMDQMLIESAKKIEELEGKLKKAGINSRAYEKRIAALNAAIEAQNTQIAELKQMIDQKDFQLAEFRTKVDQMNQAMTVQGDSLTRESGRLVNRTNELNTAYVAYGTFKELKDKGLTNREGGILGVGSTKAVNQNFKTEYFTKLDIRDTKIIPLHAKKAKMLSEHPSGSYTLVEENGQIACLQIDKPEEFWRISKFAVIEVK